MTLPSVTIVIVVYNRRDELRDVLRRMLFESAFDGKLDIVVVDNASSDDSAGMVRDEFPQVRLIARDTNIGAPAWNDGFAVATGDYVLILDDDCYLEPGDLGRAVEAAERRAAHLVSFKVVSTRDRSWVFSDRYRTGLMSFWGCAWLVRSDALATLGGYDPELFMWANELDFTIRLYDHGYRHLHLPEVVAQHMKAPEASDDPFDLRGYRTNARNWAYVAGKLLRPRDAAVVLAALFARAIRNALRADPRAVVGIPLAVAGFAHGLRHRRAVASQELSRCYRENFHTFVNPARLARPARELVRDPSGRSSSRREEFFAARPHLYPQSEAVLEFSSAGASGTRPG